jgi:hypothetical protein
LSGKNCIERKTSRSVTLQSKTGFRPFCTNSPTRCFCVAEYCTMFFFVFETIKFEHSTVIFTSCALLPCVRKGIFARSLPRP